MQLSTTRIILVMLVMTLVTSCDGRLIAAGNLLLAVVPCVLLWVTVNLKKGR